MKIWMFMRLDVVVKDTFLYLQNELSDYKTIFLQRWKFELFKNTLRRFKSLK